MAETDRVLVQLLGALRVAERDKSAIVGVPLRLEEIHCLIAAWNRRPPSPDVVELVAMLKRLNIEIGEGSSRGRAIDLLPDNTVKALRALLAKYAGKG